jgi:hypothetical protein
MPSTTRSQDRTAPRHLRHGSLTQGRRGKADVRRPLSPSGPILLARDTGILGGAGRERRQFSFGCRAAASAGFQRGGDFLAAENAMMWSREMPAISNWP